ncbi:MAG TPA: non-homologous end-joining DNA ligase, partial [Protaetiibacter sp.]|nr:non-homologous end-joining DNA ligase [Protaetiibacter sp.]
MRDAAKTPEPMGAQTDAASGSAPSFVIQEHHATRLHHDFRLERDGVLVSWALPKGIPTDPGVNHLAVQTEDHPLAYGSFEGSIPKGEYGAGTVTIWDSGSYDLEKWREGQEVIVTIHGHQHGSHRLALIRTGGSDDKPQWLIHLMKDQAAHPEHDGSEPYRKPPSTSPGRGLRRGKTVVGTRTRSADTVHPMLATTAEPHEFTEGTGWRYEMKWDGFRAIARISGDEVTLTSRNGLDLTPTFPELAALADAVTGDAVLDGEIVALDDDGVPRFSRIQQRAGLTAPRDVARARRAVSVEYYVFDVLEEQGRPLTALPYTERRARLERLVRNRGPVKVPPEAGDDLDAALATSRELRLEGVMAKRADSPYREGRRSRDWLKLKHTLTQEVIVIGWRTGNGMRADTIGSLLLGVPDDDGTLRYAGRVGTGFTDRMLEKLRRQLDGLAVATPAAEVPREDARDAHWVRPELVGEIEYSETTPDGRLRHPVWRGLRLDKNPGEVRWE